MIVDCERCPGQHVTPSACPSCVVRLLLDTQALPVPLAAPERSGQSGGPPAERAVPDLVHPEARPVAVELVRRTDDVGRPLDAAEQRAVAVLTDGGLLAGSSRGGGRRLRRVATA